MKCQRKKCDGSLKFDGFAGMGSFHSNYYKCNKCGNIYKIYDHNSLPLSLVEEGMKCLVNLCGELVPDENRICQHWGCPKANMFSEVTANWNKDDYYRYRKDYCEYRVKWSSRRKTPKKVKPRPLTYLEKNALRVRELEQQIRGLEKQK